MPELPEVETIRRGLERVALGRRIASVELLSPRSFLGVNDDAREVLIGAELIQIARRGKLLMLHLDKGFTLMAHLRMTGQLIFRDGASEAGGGYDGGLCVTDGRGSEPNNDSETAGSEMAGSDTAGSETAGNAAEADFGGGYPSRSLIGELPDRSTRVVIAFTDGSHLYFNDQRRFGYLKLIPTALLGEDDFLSRLGPEPLDADFTWRELRECLPMHSSRPIKTALLDQQVIAGIGNIYADESLFLAGIHPARPVCGLTVPAIKRLHAGIRSCLQQSLDDGGSTARDYVDAEGLRGEYLDLHAKVYGRSGQPCPKCGRPISKTRLAGRGTHFCAHCQR
ncbi:MAG: Fpg/Nei family DNA glycosylase [Coriobacteriales bacterium]|jgi:formamidopyrimidine-DNA glycosylase|nr:Fpg/Nei family DNA glycosylase [Coriobacteriales bacterium]